LFYINKKIDHDEIGTVINSGICEVGGENPAHATYCVKASRYFHWAARKTGGSSAGFEGFVRYPATEKTLDAHTRKQGDRNTQWLRTSTESPSPAT
jgi:hypothetical protein